MNKGGPVGIARLLGAFVASSAVLGLLAAGVLMPLVGVGGLASKEVVTAFDALPAQFTSSPMAQQSRIYAADGSTIATLYEENRLVVPLNKVSKEMRQAQVAIEDRRFYDHGGIDGRGLARAIFTNITSDRTEGASTLTQQYVRQLLIATARQNENEDAADAAMARSGIAGIVRKIQEAKYAISMEQHMTKSQILEGYLNIVYYGAQSYGVEAAARRYFNTTAAELTLPQAALIAGLAQNPGTADPINAPDRALARRNTVLEAMRDQGMISARTLAAASREPLDLDVTELKPSCPSATNPYVCDYVVEWLLEQPALGETVEERRKMVYHGGLNIQTTFDPDLTRRTNEILADRVSPTNSRNRGAAAAVVEPGTGRVLAIGQNTEWALEQAPGRTSLNWAVDQKYGASSGFQIGSTAKMFAVVTALEQGMTANSPVHAPPDGTRFSARQLGGDQCGMEGTFAPYNAEGEEHGGTTLRGATAESINTAFVELATKIGVCNQKETMKKMGLVRADGQDYGTGDGPGRGLAATILGADNASPLTLAASYATLGSGGIYCAPRPVEKVLSFDGTDLGIGADDCRRAVSPKVAYDATRILTSVMTEGTGRNLNLTGRASAGKTGTADNSTETWFAGFTPQRSAAVWYGTPYDQRSVGAYGATVAGPMWQRIMNRASEGLPAQRFRILDEDGESASEDDTVTVPNVVGRSRSSATRRLEQEGFSVTVADERVRSANVERGRVAQTSPEAGSEAGSEADPGDTVTIRLSNGDRG